MATRKSAAASPPRETIAASEAASAAQHDGVQMTDPFAPDRVPPGIPVVYADQVSDVVYGIHTSKIVFSMENGSGPARPVAVMVIPTASLLAATTGILQTLSSPGMVEETDRRLSEIVQGMRSLGKATAPLRRGPPKR